MDTVARIDLQTDFGTLDDEGLLWARTDWFAPGTELAPGTQLVVGDRDDTVWRVTVIASRAEWIGLRLDSPVDRV